MKKLVVLGLAAVMALGAPFSVCAAEEETTVEHPSGLKIGCAVQTMSNQVWGSADGRNHKRCEGRWK